MTFPNAENEAGNRFCWQGQGTWGKMTFLLDYVLFC